MAETQLEQIVALLRQAAEDFRTLADDVWVSSRQDLVSATEEYADDIDKALFKFGYGPDPEEGDPDSEEDDSEETT
jgi:hypothetical protein